MYLDVRLTKEKELEGQSKNQDVVGGAATSFMQGKRFGIHCSKMHG
jgi:hypothetical protein